MDPTSTLFMKIVNLLYISLVIAQRIPTMDDYRELYRELRLHADEDSSAIPHWLRASFHDMANYNPTTKRGGPNGCIRDDPVRLMAQNNQLDLPVRELNLLVHERFPWVNFPFGDVVSLAGNVW